MLGIHKKQICKNCKNIFDKPKKSEQKYCSRTCARQGRLSLDNNIFKQINHTSAYLIGLIWTDGNIYYGSRSRPILDLTTIDLQLAQEIHTILTPEKKLYTYQPKRGNRTYSIKTRDPRIIERFESFGMIPAKSHALSWPIVDLGKYLFDFIRGVFDGDGCVFVNKIKDYSYLHVSFTGCRNPFFEQLYYELKKFDPKWHNDKRTETWQIRIYSKLGIYNLAKYMYQKEKICLLRKKQKFIDNKYLTKHVPIDGRTLRTGSRKN